MKIIAIERNQFYRNPQKTWAEVQYALTLDVEVPIFIDENSIKNSTKTPVEPDILPIMLSEHLTETMELLPKHCDSLLNHTKNSVLCLDIKHLSVKTISTLANTLAKIFYTQYDKPKIYILLVDNLTGGEIAITWHQAFYILPSSLKDLQPQLKNTIRRLRLQALYIRWFGTGKMLTMAKYLLYFASKVKKKIM